jgi:type IV secretory pathway VirJ component
MLAHFLASSKNDLFNAKSISLIGYSLGTQVIKSCINRLSKLEKTDLI